MQAFVSRRKDLVMVRIDDGYGPVSSAMRTETDHGPGHMGAARCSRRTSADDADRGPSSPVDETRGPGARRVAFEVFVAVRPGPGPGHRRLAASLPEPLASGGADTDRKTRPTRTITARVWSPNGRRSDKVVGTCAGERSS